MKISLIVAMSQNRVIGREGKLPWHLPADLRRFKQLTMGHAIIMGRKTFESIGRPLPGRNSIVITSRQDFQSPGIQVAHGFNEALELARPDDEAFVIGGERVFREALHRASRIYLTKILADVDGDVVFPEFDESQWNLVQKFCYEKDDRNPFDYEFLVYDRIAL